MQPDHGIPLHGAPCAVCDYQDGVLLPGRVEHEGWTCLLPAGPVVATGQTTGGPVAPVRPLRRSPRSVAEAQRRQRRLARRVCIAGRLVAAHIPWEQHGTRTVRSEHGCECQPCLRVDADYQNGRKKGRAA